MKKYEGELIFHKRDQYGHVEVVDGPILRTLHFGTPIIQSSMILSDPFALEMEYNRVMMLSLIFDPHPQTALFLGLGGGSKPKFLWKYFPSCQIDAVEYSSVVIDVCHRYFEVPQNKRFVIYPEDAFAFLNRETDQQYNFIFIDLYIESGMSKTVGYQNFFKLCHKKLKDGGILLWNMWRTSPKELIEESVTNLTHVFGQNLLILSIEESLNFILYAFKHPIPSYTQEEALLNAKTLTSKTGMDFVKTLSDLKYFKGHGYLFQDWTI